VKLQRLSSNINPFAGISFVNNSLNEREFAQLIDNEFGASVKILDFSYSDNIGNLLMSFLEVVVVPKIFKRISGNI
jgi:hypothetical protein